MLNNNIYYHAITRKIIVGFGSLFSNIRFERKNNGVTEQLIQVPIAYAPKEKWIVRLEQDPTLENHVYTTLPRLSFEITGMNYITCGDGDKITRVYSPVPWNIDISLYCLTKTQEDALQIVEQIFPYFSPEYTMSLKGVPESNIIMDVPIILESVNIQDDYDGDFNQRRFVTYTMNFTLKANFYGPVVDGKIITNTTVDVNNITNQTPVADHTATGDTATGNITADNWSENI